jgi:hypothetical protein
VEKKPPKQLSSQVNSQNREVGGRALTSRVGEAATGNPGGRVLEPLGEDGARRRARRARRRKRRQLARALKAPPARRMEQLDLFASANSAEPARVRCLDIEPLLRGAVIEALAAVLLRPWEARTIGAAQSDVSGGGGRVTPLRGMWGPLASGGVVVRPERGGVFARLAWAAAPVLRTLQADSTGEPRRDAGADGCLERQPAGSTLRAAPCQYKDKSPSIGRGLPKRPKPLALCKRDLGPC